jgi:hypothetical protein
MARMHADEKTYSLKNFKRRPTSENPDVSDVVFGLTAKIERGKFRKRYLKRQSQRFFADRRPSGAFDPSHPPLSTP